MKPGVAFALRRLLEAALDLLDDEEPEKTEQPAQAGPPTPRKPQFFGEEGTHEAQR